MIAWHPFFFQKNKPSFTYEILVVDDGSKDATSKVSEKERIRLAVTGVFSKVMVDLSTTLQPMKMREFNFQSVKRNKELDILHSSKN